MFMYNIELDIHSCTVELEHKLEEIGKNGNYKMFHYGWDRLVFDLDNCTDFFKVANELDVVCKTYGVCYTDLLA